MKPTASPALGALTEIGAVTYPDKRTFHGILVPTRPRKDNPAIPEPAGPPFDAADVFRRFDVSAEGEHARPAGHGLGQPRVRLPVW